MKRRIIRSSVFLVIFIALTAVCYFSSSAAEYVTSGSFTYYVDGSNAVVTKYSGSAEKVSVPSKINSAKVIGIASQAFSKKSSIKTLSLPSTIQSIGSAAFNECTGLTKLVLPSNLKTISSSAFWYCTNLKSIYIPKSVTSIASNSFKGCKNLTAYVISGSYAEKYVKASSDVKLGYRYVSSLKAEKTALTVAVASTKKINYTIKPSVVMNNKVVFKSSNTKVATVSSSGVVKAVSCGKATITMITADGSKKTAKVTITVVPQKVTGLKMADNNITAIKLTWNASKGAKGYGVYCYDSANKKWVLKKSTTSRSYVESGLKTGYSAYYKVVAFTKAGKTVYKASDSAKVKASVLTPGKITSLTTESTTKTITLSWKQASDATGYRVYLYNTKTKAYETVTDTVKLSATVKNLKANTKYLFRVRAYLVYKTKTVFAKEYVNDYAAYTLPSSVSGFTFDYNSVTTTGARLIWDAMSGIDGYELYSCKNASGDGRTLVAKLSDNSITGYTISNLKSGQKGYYVIRPYVKRSKTVYGGFTSVLTITALAQPKTANEAFNGFIKALNASKNADSDFHLIKTTEVSDLTGEHLNEYIAVTNAVAVTKTEKYHFSNGIEDVSALPATYFISPANTDSDLTYKEIKSCEFKDEKDGYSVIIDLNSETVTSNIPSVYNAKIAPTVTWYGLVSSFYLGSCIYEGTHIEAMVKNGKIDSMTIVMPMQYEFKYKGTEGCKVSETVTYTYIFGW